MDEVRSTIEAIAPRAYGRLVAYQRGEISQGVFADANSPDASKERILPLLSSLTYTLERVPSEQELHEVIVSVLRAHPKYVPDPEG